MFAHTFNIGTGELAVILLVGLLIFGPNKLPEAARRAGKAMRALRKISNSFRDEIRNAMAEPASPSADAAADSDVAQDTDEASNAKLSTAQTQPKTVESRD